MPLDNTAVAQRISDNILSADDGILAISIMDIKGNILAARSKQSFKETFGLTIGGEKYMVVFWQLQLLVWLMK